MPEWSRSTDSEKISPENLHFLLQYIHSQSGITIGEDKQYLLRNRLMPLVEKANLGSLDRLCDRLREGASRSFQRLVVEAMATHETLFFRDPSVFEALRKTILPEIAFRREAAKTLRIWSAGCSSGQEPYSVAMLLLELGYGNWSIQLLASDLSSQILERAEAGRFQQIEVNRGLPAVLLAKYFQRIGNDWQIKDSVRRMVRFSNFDLRQEMRSLGPFDLVLCRNVLIYFNLENRKTILARIRKTLFPGAYLLLGSSETTFNLEESYVRRTVDKATFYRRPE